MVLRASWRWRTVGEGDECTCAQCRGAELPEWLRDLSQLDELGDRGPGQI